MTQNFVRLGDIADVVRGVTYGANQAASSHIDGYVPILRAGNIQSKLVLDEGLVWTPASVVSDKQLIRKNDLVMCTSSGSSDVVGKVAKAEADWHGSFGAFCAVIRPNAKMVSPSFLGHFLSAPAFRAWTKKSAGANIKNIRKSELDDYIVQLPQLEQQISIAATLDKVDSIRKKRSETLKLADEFLRSVFIDMFGNPATNSMGWDDVPITEIAIVTTGNTPSRQVLDYFGDHIEWIKSDNINTSNHHLTKATEGLSKKGLEIGRSAPAGSTLVTCIAGSPACIGNAALSDRRVAFNQQINALTPKPGIEPEFLYAVTLFSKVRIQAASTNGMKGMVSKGALEQVHFILPPKPARLTFVRAFKKVLATLQKMHLALDEADHLFESLQQQAFS